MHNHFKVTLLFLSLNIFGIQSVTAQDTLWLTAKEYNDLLVRGNCTDIIKADSTLLWDKQQEIGLLNEVIVNKNVYISASDSQIKKSKRQIIKYKVGMFGAIVLGITTNLYLIFNK